MRQNACVLAGRPHGRPRRCRRLSARYVERGCDPTREPAHRARCKLLRGLDGADLRAEPLERPKDALARLLKRAPFGLVVNEHHAGEGPALFAATCERGLEGIVSKRRGLHYSSGRSTHWVKAKNPN